MITTINSNVGIGLTAPTAKLEVSGALRLTPSTAPASPQQGMMYYDSGTGKFKCYDASGIWKDCGGVQAGPAPSGALPFIIRDSAGNLVLEVNQE